MLFLDSDLDESVAVAFGVRLLSSAVFESPQEEQASEDSGFCLQCDELEARLRSPRHCAPACIDC